MKKVGERPLSTHRRRPAPARKLSSQDTTAPARRQPSRACAVGGSYRGQGMADAAVRELVDRYLAALEGDTRRVADREWGISVEAAGWPLHVGVALRDGLLRAQAEVLGPGRLQPEALLRWNRGLGLVRFSHTAAGDVYIEGALPLEAVTEARLDGFLGLLVRVATQAREAAGA
jgi:hypothetical protein